MKIYIDESGSLGNVPDTYFILAAFIQFDHNAASRCIKKIRNKIIKKRYKELSELKYSNSSDDIRAGVLSYIAKQDVQFYYIAYNKRPGNTDLTSLSCAIIIKLLQGILQDYDEVPEIHIDRYLNGKQQDKFNADLQAKLGVCSVVHVDSKLCCRYTLPTSQFSK